MYLLVLKTLIKLIFTQNENTPIYTFFSSQVSDPVAAEFSLNTQMFLLSKKEIWLSDGSMGFAEGTDVAFTEGKNWLRIISTELNKPEINPYICSIISTLMDSQFKATYKLWAFSVSWYAALSLTVAMADTSIIPMIPIIVLQILDHVVLF